MKKLIDYIRADLTIKIAKLESLATIPKNTLQNVLNETGRELPSRHAANILETLIKLRGGIIQIDDLFFENVENQKFYVWGIFEENEIVEPIEIENEEKTQTYFKYPVNLHKAVIEEFELYRYLE